MENQEQTNVIVDQKRFISQDFDKFKNSATTKLVWPAKFSKRYTEIWVDKNKYEDTSIRDWIGMSLDLTLRHVKTPEIESCLIDYFYLGANWMFIRNGNMIINIDGVENITLEPHESDTEVGVGHRNAIAEVGYYTISKENLKRVCDAKAVEVRISGSSSYHVINNEPDQDSSEKTILPGDKFLWMCRAFYAGLYEDSSYNEQIEAVIPIGTENEKPAGAGGGCFIATAAMGDYDHPVVMDLRLFRDNWLLQRDWGVKFTKWYYTHGPKAAKIIDKSTILKKITFMVIVKPLQVLTKSLGR